MQWLYSLLFSLLIFICAGKRPDNCPLPKCPEKCSSQPTNCKGGLAYDYRYCECCPVCAKTEGETCGGAFSEKGSCDRGLTCTNLNSLGVGTCQNSKLNVRIPGTLFCTKTVYYNISILWMLVSLSRQSQLQSQSQSQSR